MFALEVGFLSVHRQKLGEYFEPPWFKVMVTCLLFRPAFWKRPQIPRSIPHAHRQQNTAKTSGRGRKVKQEARTHTRTHTRKPTVQGAGATRQDAAGSGPEIWPSGWGFGVYWVWLKRIHRFRFTQPCFRAYSIQVGFMSLGSRVVVDHPGFVRPLL